MTEIYLVRHGETDWNKQRRLQGRQDIPLNDAGREQAARLAEIFSRLGISAVASSNLSRARDTAQAVAAASGIAGVTEYPDLTERDFGSASGMTYEEKAASFPNNIVPQAESNEALYKRAVACLHDIAERNAGKTAVVVSHGGTINAILFYLTSGTHGTGITTLKNGSVTKLRHENGAFMPVYINAEPRRVLDEEGYLDRV